jgi:nucleoside-diphosphate-sugar epimerase
MIVAVIGARGFAGSFLASDLLQRGHKIVPVLSSTPLPGDAFDVVLDCNGDSRRFWAEENAEESFQANVVSVVARATRLRCRKYLYLSTIDVYGDNCDNLALTTEDAAIDLINIDAYGLQKYLAEQIVVHYCRRPLILRLGTLIGPGLRKNPIYDALNHAPIRQTRSSTLSLLDLRTLAESIAALLAADVVGIFNLTGTPSISIDRILRAVGSRIGLPLDAFSFHDQLFHRTYNISVEKIGKLMSLPDSGTMLDYFLGEWNP